MARYSGVRRSITPNVSSDNWGILAVANESSKTIEVHWGGEATTSTAMQTRVARGSGQTGTVTAGNVAKIHPNSPTNLLDFAISHGTTQPTLDAGDLFSESWNAHGGVVRWLAAPGEEFVNIGVAAGNLVSCRNSVGTATSTYGTVWEED